MKVSVCIPTYNRAAHLNNCLQSIIINKSNSSIDFQVCVSDNCSTDGTEEVVRCAQKIIDIKYNKNTENLGIPQNFLNVVEMADGEFIWLLGDDDLLMPNAMEELNALINTHNNVDYFYINSFHLTTQYVFSFPQPFDTSKLPAEMIPFSQYQKSGEMDFIRMINPEISFDYLGGMFLSVFRKHNWEMNIKALDESAITDSRTFSHFDNTFPHIKIFSRAFVNSKAYFNAKPLSVCLTGAREWAPMYPFVRSIRIVEALDEYRKNGLPYIQYLICKNYALKYFLPDITLMMLNKNNSGIEYIKPFRVILSNCMFPNFYLSAIYYLARKINQQLNKYSPLYWGLMNKSRNKLNKGS